jgi:hypothetical protein
MIILVCKHMIISVCKRMRIWVYKWMSMWVCKHVIISVCKHMRTWVYKYMSMWVCKHMIISVCKHVRTWECKHMRIWVCKNMFMCVRKANTCVASQQCQWECALYTSTHIKTWYISCKHMSLQIWLIRTIYVYIHTYIHTYTHTHTYIYIDAYQYPKTKNWFWYNEHKPTNTYIHGHMDTCTSSPFQVFPIRYRSPWLPIAAYKHHRWLLCVYMYVCMYVWVCANSNIRDVTRLWFPSESTYTQDVCMQYVILFT